MTATRFDASGKADAAGAWFKIRRHHTKATEWLSLPLNLCLERQLPGPIL